MKKQVFLWIFVIGTLPGLTQYNGGSGDGMDKSSVIQSNLDGVIGGIVPLYQGGSGDGVDRNRVSSFLNGSKAEVLFSGGRGDGFVSNTASLYLNGTNLDILYQGGLGDGFDNNQYEGFLEGTGSFVLYNGGDGDGFDKKSFSGSVGGLSSDAYFSGGAGDGFSNAQVQAFLNGLSLDVIYNGGDGDGFANALFSGTLIVLPIELISFDAIKQEDYVLVKWVTEGEKSTPFFTVERSQNGVLFKNLVVVPGQTGSSLVQVYTTNDRSPLKGRSYYRLKWIGADGQSQYSEIRSVLFDQKNQKDFLLYPNPNNGNNLFVQLEGVEQDEKISVSLLDLQGKVIYQTNTPSIAVNKISIPLNGKLPKGSYVVRVIRNQEVSSKVLIVQ